MAATTKVRDFLRSVCTTLQDISPQFSRWTEQELVVYANYGQLALAKFLPQAGSRVDVIKLAPGTRQDITKVLAANIKPGDGSTPADAHGICLAGEPVRNMGQNGTTAGRVVRTVDRYTLDSNDPDWHTRVCTLAHITAGTAVREVVYDKTTPRVFYVSPGVSASYDVWIELPWMVEPPRIPAGGEPNARLYEWDGPSTTLLGINDQFVEDLHNYVVGIALLKGSKNVQNIPKAQAHAGMFVSSVNAQAQLYSGVNPNLKLLPFADQIPAAA